MIVSVTPTDTIVATIPVCGSLLVYTPLGALILATLADLHVL